MIGSSADKLISPPAALPQNRAVSILSVYSYSIHSDQGIIKKYPAVVVCKNSQSGKL